MLAKTVKMNETCSIYNLIP